MQVAAVYALMVKMANPKPKPHSHREKASNSAPPAVDAPAMLPTTSADAGETAGRAARLTLIVWLVGFLFLAFLILWDLFAALFLR